ncbi:TIGR00366 family protein [Alteromonas sp. MmMcT2-5]|jgi:short-chain fatty acids transporter|uniref:short-chain fatty acid transporter n=1 Tax=Alteromonas sp. MmMcT2-5 TaxID=2917733 RepID=UPI001EF36CCC|nr:TIGR00366 family protein [Alteromonas sp. MmMcT2-5]MCG7651504.1 TIGR00366 family protein [Alteromonas sp. MmMcT2-5]
MLNRASKPFVKLVERYLPDPYIFVLLLTLITLVFAVVIQGQSPLTTVQQWGDGFWGLLTFSMQMLLVLVTGFMLACTPLVKALLERLASLAKSPGSAIVLVTLVSLIASWINWGFGLVVGALFAKALARKVSVDYRLLVASAYSGFIVWHGGLAGSVPLTIATPGHFSEAQIGVVGTGETIFSGFNLLLLAIMFVIIPLVNRLMLPPESESIIVDSAKLKDDALPSATNERPADRLENSKVLGLLVGFAGLAYLTNYFVSGGALNLNIVNTLFLFLAIVLHGTPRNVLHSLQQAVQGGSGIVIQFPFYAGIMAVMVQSGLAQTMSEWLISFASAESLPVWSFISAGIVNIFVPSGGGQWAVQAPVILPAAAELGAEINRVAMAVAWGDAWTNLIQPFWALPVLAIAGLKAKDIMGFCLVQLIVTGVIISLVLRFV